MLRVDVKITIKFAVSSLQIDDVIITIETRLPLIKQVSKNARNKAA